MTDSKTKFRALLSFSILLLSACAVFTPPNSTARAPTPASAAQSTDTTPALDAHIPSPSAAPANLPRPPLDSFDAALRLEFRADLERVPAPTIYRLKLRLNQNLSELGGEESITYTNRETENLDAIYFRLFANYPSGKDRVQASSGEDRLQVSSVKVDGAEIKPTFQVENTALRVPLARPLAPGNAINMQLVFTVTIPFNNESHYADFTNSDGIVTLPSVYPLIPAYDEGGWHIELPPAYGDLVYADASFYDVYFTAPVGQTVIGSGATVGTTTQGYETTWHFVGAPLRDFNFDVSAVWRKASALVGDVTINSYYLPEDARGGDDALKWASDALRVYEKRSGAYPFKELDVVETPTAAGGIEYPGVIVITRGLYREPEQRHSFEFVVAHEVAHQWWYAVVGDDQVNHPWLDEALAQYMTLLYMEETYGARVAAGILQDAFGNMYERARQANQDMPIGLPVAAYSAEQYVLIVYNKGPLFFDAVRKQIGDDKFFQFLQTYYTRYKYQIAAPADLLATLEQVSGQNLHPLYAKWVGP